MAAKVHAKDLGPLKTVLTRLRSGHILVLLAAILVGSALRLIGLTWGLPAALHPDEWVIVDGAIGMAERNSFEPEFYMRPDHVEIKLSYLAYALVAHLGLGTSIEAAYAIDPGLFLYVSRLITALFGIAQIPLAYAIGRRLHPAVGAIASVLFAIFPPFVEHSHYATPDIPLTTMTLVVILASMRYLARPRMAPLVVASLAVSVSICIKYPGAISASAIALVVIWAAIADRRPLRIATHGFVAVAIVIAGVFAISPSLFTNASGVVAAVRQESRSTHPGADGLGFGGNLIYYARDFIDDAGALVGVLALVGAWFAIQKRATQLIPAIVGVITWVVVSALPLHWARWGLPMYIAPLLFAAFGAVVLYQLVLRHWPRALALTGAAAIGTLVAGNLLLGATVTSVRLVAPDTRLVALSELTDKGITASNSTWEGYSPFQPGSGRNVFADFEMQDGQVQPIDPEIDYLVLSSCMNQRYLNDPKYTMEQSFYAAVNDQASLLVSYTYVRPEPGSWLEPVSIFSHARTLAAFAGGAMNGCDIDVYELTSADPEA